MLEMRAANKNSWDAEAAAAALQGTNAVMTEAKSLTGKYYDGKISENELQAEYERLSERYVAAFVDSGYPTRLTCGSIQNRLGAQELFYDEFRMVALKEAVSRNNAEGQQYATGEKGAKHTVKYYNSDYYYKSEAAIAAITKGAYAVAEESKALCKELGYIDYEFEVPDYKSDMYNLYYNFNSAWSNNFLANDQYITDYDQIPPKNFQWFYETGGSGSDGNTASTWARLQDESGLEHYASRNFSYEDGVKGLFQVSELLQFNIRDYELDAQVKRFLSSLQVFQRGYFFDRYAAGEMNVFA